MGFVKSILQLVRFNNLIFIALTQYLVYIFIVTPNVFFQKGKLYLLDGYSLVFLIFSTILIAAAGYIINDYFDLRIDRVNKPKKIVIDKIITRKTALILHILLNVFAIILCFIVAKNINLKLFFLQLSSIFLLLVYSTTFKRKLIIGNLIIAFLAAMSIATILFYEPYFNVLDTKNYTVKMAWLFIVFSFLITWIREIIKDLEDMKGDAVENSSTLPLHFGILKTKKIIFILLILLEILICVTSIYFFKTNIFFSIYLFIALFLPIIVLFFIVKKSNVSIEFNLASKYIKWITLFGILGIILI